MDSTILEAHLREVVSRSPEMRSVINVEETVIAPILAIEATLVAADLDLAHTTFERDLGARAGDAPIWVADLSHNEAVLALTLRAASQKLETKTNELLVPNNIATLGNILSLSARVRIGIALDEETATIITNMAIQQVVTERGIRLLVAKKATAWAHPHLSDPNEPQVPLHARILRNAADNNFVVVVDTTASLIDLLSGCGVSK